MRRRSDNGLSSLVRACPAVAVLAVLAISCSPPTANVSIPPRSNILLITIDTLRADHLSAYGYPRLTSPVLDRLAAEGVRFDRPAVQWPKTGPSFASMFTSTYSKDNGIVRKIGIPVPDEFNLLAEELAARGFATAAVVSNGALAAEFNFDQGFDLYVETWRTSETGGDPNRAERVTDAALAIAGELQADRPFFLWVHYLDPHFPYDPPEDYADRFVDDEIYDPTPKIDIDYSKPRKQMTGIGRDMVLDGRDELAFYEARYDAEILYADTEIGRLLDGLGAAGQLDDTLIAVTSDHGESLGEHYYYFDHGRFSFQTCLRVPLILHFPGMLEPQVVDEPVQLIDLAPTLLHFAGKELEGGAWMQGRTLVDRLTKKRSSTDVHLAFSEAGYGSDGKWQRAVQDERYKLVLVRTRSTQKWLGGPGVLWVLYDLVEDPGETENLLQELPDEARRLQKELTAWLNAEPFPLGAEVGSERGEMDEATRRQLEALGYLD